MKRITLFTIATILVNSLTFAQTATIKFSFKNATFDNYVVFPQTGVFGNQRNPTYLSPDKNGTLIYTLKLTEPKFISFNCYDSKSNETLMHFFFLSPDDRITFSVDMLEKENQITVTGKGSNNNQPFAGSFLYFNYDQFNGDTIPNRIINAI